MSVSARVRVAVPHGRARAHRHGLGARTHPHRTAGTPGPPRPPPAPPALPGPLAAAPRVSLWGPWRSEPRGGAARQLRVGARGRGSHARSPPAGWHQPRCCGRGAGTGGGRGPGAPVALGAARCGGSRRAGPAGAAPTGPRGPRRRRGAARRPVRPGWQLPVLGALPVPGAAPELFRSSKHHRSHATAAVHRPTPPSGLPTGRELPLAPPCPTLCSPPGHGAAGLSPAGDAQRWHRGGGEVLVAAARPSEGYGSARCLTVGSAGAGAASRPWGCRGGLDPTLASSLCCASRSATARCPGSGVVLERGQGWDRCRGACPCCSPGARRSGRESSRLRRGGRLLRQRVGAVCALAPWCWCWAWVQVEQNTPARSRPCGSTRRHRRPLPPCPGFPVSTPAEALLPPVPVPSVAASAAVPRADELWLRYVPAL